MTKFDYLMKNVFYNLNNLNIGFDSWDIFYFNEEEFSIVLNRVEKLGLGIYGIEPFYKGNYFDCRVYEEYPQFKCTDHKWYQQVFQFFKSEQSNLQYSASYYIPKKLIQASE